MEKDKLGGFKSPCLNCAERHELCHDDCVRYKEFTEQNAKRLKEDKYNKWLKNLGYMRRDKK